tara:strand:- start:1332 stop:1508 length:177 start_codon:yes stop_codon:yes gene_type:complete
MSGEIWGHQVAIAPVILDQAREEHAVFLQGGGDVARLLEADGFKVSAEWVREAIRRLK